MLKEIRCEALVIGAGPAGLTAAIYLKRNNVDTLVVRGKNQSALAKAHKIENYTGFQSISGPDLLAEMTQQAKNLGIKILDDDILALTLTMDPKMASTKTAFITIQLLANKNLPIKMDNDSIAMAALHNFYDINKADSISFIKKKIVNFHKEKICFYFYSVNEKNNNSFAKTIKTIAFFMNGKDLNPLAFTTFYDRTIEEDGNEEEKIEAIIKESLDQTHFRASYEKQKEENYNTNYLYEDY